MKQISQCCQKTDAQEQIDHIAHIVQDMVDLNSNLIQILHTVQNIYGSLPLTIQKMISEKTKMSLAEISGVISFYSYFSTQPKGKHIIKVCMGTACYVRGSKKIIERLQEILHIGVGDTTDDRLFTLEVVRCMGACGLAPAIAIDDKVYKMVKPEKLSSILKEYYPKEGTEQ